MGYNSGNRDYGGDRPQMSPPVNVGDILNVKIEAVGEKGDGIAREKGFVLFVPNTQEGQMVKIKVTKVLRKVGFAEVVGEADASEIKESSRPRQEQKAPEPEPEEPSPEDTENFGEEPSKEEPKSEEDVPAPDEPEPDTGDEDDLEEDVPKPDEG